MRALSTNDPWLICGDLNCVMDHDEHIGAIARQAEMVDIIECMQDCQLHDMKSTGNLYTWNNKQKGKDRLYSKLDRVMINDACQGEYQYAETCFLQEGEFDHSPGVITVYPRPILGKKPFKYYTMWKTSPQYNDIIEGLWREEIRGTKMFIICQKLKKIKVALKELNKEGFNDVHTAEVKAYKEMIDIQTQMHNNPGDVGLADAEIDDVHKYHVKHGIYVAYLRKKAKAEWIRAGDENTSVMHQSIRISQNQVYSIFDAHGVWIDKPEEVPNAFLAFYKELLGTVYPHRTQTVKQIVQEGPVINEHHREILNTPYTRDEIRKALFFYSWH